MSKTAVNNPVATLREAIKLSQSSETETQQKAHDVFGALREQLDADNPELLEMIQILWMEVVSARRSASFWQELCQVEKHLSERISENHLQLKQDYQRLIQKN
ncbi:MAG: hypothetical protein QNJ46_34375 [Leptolyngbyaceae cyanobacterium MO_188.B28]|nr:hypothetical protein [Leptolyngbyaceae cyanobacterium MO_188.B28]